MFGIGMTELLVILVVALLVFGPTKLPELARSLGRAMHEFRRASNDLRASFNEAVDPGPATPPRPAPSIAPPKPAPIDQPEAAGPPAAAGDAAAAPAAKPAGTGDAAAAADPAASDPAERPPSASAHG